MSVLLPIIFLIVSLGSIALILYRKIDYIHKLSPEVLSDNKMVDGGFFRAYFAELYEYAQGLNLRSQAVSLLSDVAKVLRGFKIFFLKIERHTSELIRAIQTAVQEQEEQIAQERKRSQERPPTDDKRSLQTTSHALDNIARETAAMLSDPELHPSPHRAADSDLEARPGDGSLRTYPLTQASASKNIPDTREDNPYGAGVMALDSGVLEDLRLQEQRLILAIAKTPRDPDLYKIIGDIYTQTEEYEDAKEAYQRALKLDPDDYIIKTKLAKVLRKLERIV